MPILEKLSKYRNIPVALIYKGADVLGVELAKLLIEQGAFVILIDEYSKKNKNNVLSLIGKDLFTFLDISGTESVRNSISRLDYIFFLNHRIDDESAEIATSEFLEKSNRLDKLLQLGVEKKSKFLLTSSVAVHKKLQVSKENFEEVSVADDNLSYTVLEVQRYIENLAWEYYKRGGLDARIVRVGELLGEGIDIERKSTMNRFIKAAISGGDLEVFGDGLDHMYFVYVLDAAYGLIKAQFSEKTTGRVFTLAIPQDITELNLAYKVQELEPKSGEIKFIDKKSAKEIEIYKPAANLSEIGWKEKVSFERGLAQTIDFFYRSLGKSGKSSEDIDVRKSKAIEAESKLRKKMFGKRGKKRRTLKDFFLNFFFEDTSKSKKPSVLDNIQYAQVQKRQEQKETKRKFLERKKPRRSRISLFKRLQWIFLDAFRSVGTFFRQMTFPKFFAYLILIIFLGTIYVFLIVPFIQISFFSAKAYYHSNSIERAFEEKQFFKADRELSRLITAFEKIEYSLDKVSYFSKIRVFSKLQTFKGDVGNYKSMMKEAKKVSEYLVPIENYFDNYTTNVAVEATGDITVSESSAYDLEKLDDLGRDVSDIERNLSNFEIVQRQIDIPILSSSYPTFLQNLEGIRQAALETTSVLKIAPTLLATERAETYAILLLDQSKMTTLGGKVVAVCIFTFESGRVTNAKVYDASEIDLHISSEQIQILQKDLKLLYPKNGLSLADLTLINDEKTFASLMKYVASKKYGADIDHIVTLNFPGLSEILARYGGIVLNTGKTVNSTNLEEVMADSDVSKKEILAKSFERMLDFSFADIETNAFILKNEFEKNNLNLYTSDEYLNDFLLESGLVEDHTGSSFDDVKISFVTKKGNLPKIELEEKVDLKKQDSFVDYVFSFEKSNDEAYEGIAIIELGPSFKITDTKLSSTQVRLASSYTNKVYLNLNLTDVGKEEVVILGKSPNIVTKEESLYNYKLEATKPHAFSYSYEIVLNYGAFYELQDAPVEVIRLENSSKIIGTIDKDLEWDFEFGKK